MKSIKRIVVLLCMIVIAGCSDSSYCDVKKETKFETVTACAQKGFRSDQASLGLMYYDGDGVKKSNEKAVYWLSKAAERGSVSAQYGLARLYKKDGCGLPCDRLAAKWYRKAADQGDYMSQLIIGDMYIRGAGVIQDKVLAHMWFNIATLEGTNTAREKMDRIAKEMSPSQIEKAQDMAREWVAKQQD